MVDPNIYFQNLIKLLDDNSVEYKLFSHKEALTWEELAEVQKETGFFGTEMKCMVLNADGKIFVYVTLQGQKLNLKTIQDKIGVGKVKLCTPDELNTHFGAKPGCAYPFGFDSQYDIFVDPKIYGEEWMLFSPVFPDKTIQARGVDLQKVFNSLDNKVEEVRDFNL